MGELLFKEWSGFPDGDENEAQWKPLIPETQIVKKYVRFLIPSSGDAENIYPHAPPLGEVEDQEEP